MNDDALDSLTYYFNFIDDMYSNTIKEMKIGKPKFDVGNQLQKYVVNKEENEMKFKVGDKVRCINDSMSYLLLDKIYVVTKIRNGFISVDDKSGWVPDRFILVEEFSYKNHLIDFIESHGELETVSIIEQYNGDYNIVAVPLPKIEEQVYGLCLDNLSKTQYEQIKNFLNLD